MEKKNKVKEYRSEDLIVYWYPELCSHSGKCIEKLPQVFRIEERPWVCIDGADSVDIVKTIDVCPTGALKYRLTENSAVDPNQANGPGSMDYKVSQPAIVQIRMVEGGPLLVKGPARVLDPEGNSLRECESMVLCRCGKTKNPPFCDGSHIEKHEKND